MGGVTCKSDKKVFQPQSPGRPKGSGGAQKDDARGRSASAEIEGKGKNRIRTSVLLTREEHVFGDKSVDSLTRRNVGDPLPPNLAEEAKRFVISTQVGIASSENCRETHSTRSPSPGGKGKKQEAGDMWKEPPAASAAAAPATSILRPIAPRTGPISVALEASSYDLGPGENIRPWLLDTRCKYDLATRSSMPQHQVYSTFTAPMPILLATANDLAQGDKVVSQYIGELGEVTEPYVLDSAPTFFP